MALRDSIEHVVAQSIRYHRNRLDMSQAELARRMSAQGHRWHQMTVNRCEEGERPLRVSEAVALAGIFDISLHKLLERPRLPEDEDVRRRLIEMQERIVQLEAERATLAKHRDSLARRAHQAQVDAGRAAQRADAAMIEAREAEIIAVEADRSADMALAQLRRVSVELDTLRGALSYEMENSLAAQSVTLSPEDLLDHLDDVVVVEDENGGYWLEVLMLEGEGGIRTGPHESGEEARAHYKRLLQNFVHSKRAQVADESSVSAPIRGREKDQAEHGTRSRRGKFVLKRDTAGQFRFNLLASNGQVIASSEAYGTKAAALDGIDTMKRAAGSNTQIVDS